MKFERNHKRMIPGIGSYKRQEYHCFFDEDALYCKYSTIVCHGKIYGIEEIVARAFAHNWRDQEHLYHILHMPVVKGFYKRKAKRNVRIH